MHFCSQVSDKAVARRHFVGGDGRSWDDRHRGSRWRKPEGNGRCSVSLQQLAPVPSSWRTSESLPLISPSQNSYQDLYTISTVSDLQNLSCINDLGFVQISDVSVNSAGGARVGASDWFSAYPGLAAGHPHPLQQRGAGNAPAFPQKQLTGCTWGSQPGGGAVDQRQTGEKLESSDWT